jgi:hypothetical protein
MLGHSTPDIKLEGVLSSYVIGPMLALWWWVGVIFPGGFWQITALTTAGAAVVFWLAILGLSRWIPWVKRNRTRWTIALTVTSAVSSLIVWLIVPLARNHFIEFTSVVCGTGAVLGALVAAFTKWTSNPSLQSGPPQAPAAEFTR